MRTNETLDNTENGQSRETDNIRYTRRRKTKQKHNTICFGHYYTQTNTHNVNKTWLPYKQLEVKMKQTLFLCENRNRHHNTEIET